MDLFPPTAQQLAVIEHRGANLLVLAGPGTGKTETLARRFASLVAGGIAPNQILVLTFSRRAADEMRERVLLRLRQLRKTSLAVSELYVKTFHGFCSRLLDGDNVRTHCHSLMTPVKERLLWNQLMQSGTLAFSSFAPDVAQSAQFATDCLNVIGQLKSQGIAPGRLASLARDDARLFDLASAYGKLEEERGKLGLRDYRDLVNEAERDLGQPESAAAAWLRSADFRHILVDEFQDSDRMQLRLLLAMRARISPEPRFCFVGDKNQSIYRFRGASPGNVDAARESFACTTLVLHDNRRSAQAILDVANADEELDGESKTKAADAHKIGIVRLARPRALEDEVREIRDAVARKIAAGTAPQAIAVLLRQTQPYQELIIDALREAEIPVAAQPTAGFHDDALIDAVLTALRLLATPADAMLWQRLLNNPIVGYRPIDVCYAFDAGRRDRMSDPKSMLRLTPPHGVRTIEDFLRAWERCVQAHGKRGPIELVETVVRELDLLRPVRENRPVEGFDPTASPLRLQALLDAAADYGLEWKERGHPARAPVHGVAEFISRLDETIGLIADAHQPPPSIARGVRVISIHAAKGLEFDFVVVPQLIDGILPASARPNRLLPLRSIRLLRNGGVDIFVDDNEARSEEHSLWYVALTRAKSDVLATAPQVDDEGVDTQLSPFALFIRQSGEVEPSAETVSAGPDRAVDQARPLQRPPSPRRSETSIRLPIETLSPTGIGTFILCPRRFFYGEVLRLPRREGDATLYGLKLHAILRRFHEVETNFENVTDERAAASRYAQKLQEITGEETGSVASSALGPLDRFEREDLERRLTLYACDLAREAHAAPFAVLACEQNVASTFEGLTVAGRVDRIDRLTSGELIVRDYKSGRYHGRLAQAVGKALAQIDDGVDIFGDAPDGFNVQTILYVPGVEELFGQRVCRLDYFYFRGKDADSDDLFVDKTVIAESGRDGGLTNALTRTDLARVRRDVAGRIAVLCGSGTMKAFATTRDEQLCNFCDFVRICPGPGKVAMA